MGNYAEVGWTLAHRTTESESEKEGAHLSESGFSS